MSRTKRPIQGNCLDPCRRSRVQIVRMSRAASPIQGSCARQSGCDSRRPPGDPLNRFRATGRPLNRFKAGTGAARSARDLPRDCVWPSCQPAARPVRAGRPAGQTDGRAARQGVACLFDVQPGRPSARQAAKRLDWTQGHSQSPSALPLSRLPSYTPLPAQGSETNPNTTFDSQYSHRPRNCGRPR